jgi:hypothetical protein
VRSLSHALQTGYFSYAHDLAHPEGTLLEQTALVLRDALAADLPELRRARKIEWWAHNRGEREQNWALCSELRSDHEMGHQLHWDTDAEGAAGVKNPLVSVIIYLSHGVGGPTAMTEQRLGEPIATHGWLVPVPEQVAQVGRVAAFRGAYLHGVVGGHPAHLARRDARRKTLMIAFWEDVKIRPSLFETPGTCRPLPASHPAWLAEMERPLAELEPVGARVPVPLFFVKPFFASTEGKELTTMEMPPYESVFQ